jgi:hypothetical protein
MCYIFHGEKHIVRKYKPCKTRHMGILSGCTFVLQRQNHAGTGTPGTRGRQCMKENSYTLSYLTTSSFYGKYVSSKRSESTP